MQRMLTKAKRYSVVILKAGPNKSSDGIEEITFSTGQVLGSVKYCLHYDTVVSGIDWKQYKHPLPEHAYDIYMKSWADVDLAK